MQINAPEEAHQIINNKGTTVLWETKNRKALLWEVGQKPIAPKFDLRSTILTDLLGGDWVIYIFYFLSLIEDRYILEEVRVIFRIPKGQTWHWIRRIKITMNDNAVIEISYDRDGDGHIKLHQRIPYKSQWIYGVVCKQKRTKFYYILKE